MKKWFAGCLICSVLAFGSLCGQAMGMGWWHGEDRDHRGSAPYNDADRHGVQDTRTYDTPEPATLAILAAGIAGIGGYYVFRRKNRRGGKIR